MESDNRLPTGEWNGFFLENHQPRRGWMHLYLAFADGKIKGEGTDYVAPWICRGSYDLESGHCSWVKQYVGLHQVVYSGKIGQNGILGGWEISYISGQFHIWPQKLNKLNELYMADDLTEPSPTIQLGTVSANEFSRLA